MKYKVGDRVKIKNDFNCDKKYEVETDKKMEKYAGRIMTVRKIDGNLYKMKEDNEEHYSDGWYWSEDMIEGLATFTKSDLKDGDVVTYRNGDKRTKISNRLLNEDGSITNWLHSYNEDLTREYKERKETDIIKIERPTQYETVYERKEEILDEAEKKYLRSVIKPFRDTVRFIEKEDNGVISRIKIRFNYHFMFFPMLEKEKKMYEGMKANRAYNLKELGL